MLANYENNSLTVIDPGNLAGIIGAVCNTVGSDNSKRAYRAALENFITWYAEQGQPALCKAVVQAYINHLRAAGLGAATINQRMAAVRSLIREAADNQAIDQADAAAILRIKGEKKLGKRLGNWLTKPQAQSLLNAPAPATLKGKRDRALLAVMIGAGLRRSEVAALEVAQIQQREGRWAIVDLVGKGKRIRTIPLNAMTKAALDNWLTAAGITAGKVFRPINKGGRLSGESMTSQSVYETVEKYAAEQGVNIAAHDLRRTCAKLMRKGGGDLKQIQMVLGHASITTTEIYLGEMLDFSDSPVDKIGLTLYSD